MKRRWKLRSISTSTLRGMSIALARRPWSKLFRQLRWDVEAELLARDLDLLADESGGFPCSGPMGLQ